MTDDEHAIREVFETWHRATAAGDVETLRGLMSEDATYLQPGQPPMKGRDAFLETFQKGLQHVHIESSGVMEEINVVGEVAYCRNLLDVKVTPKGGGPVKHRKGYTLTVFRKQPNDRWVLVRDANLMLPG